MKVYLLVFHFFWLHLLFDDQWESKKIKIHVCWRVLSLPFCYCHQKEWIHVTTEAYKLLMTASCVLQVNKLPGCDVLITCDLNQ